MKYYLQLALVAVFLFSVSAALSLWLNQPKPTTEAKDEKPKKGATDDHAAEKDKDKEKSALPKVSPALGGHDTSPAAATLAVREREDRLERRQAQMAMVMRDLESEQAAYDALVRRVTDEAKAAATRAAEPPPLAVVPKKETTLDALAEKKNIEQLARLYDAMTPEAAAPILRQMADSGKIDTAVRILASMKDRQAAQVLGAFGDTELAVQVTERVRLLKKLAPAGAGSNVAPAAGP
jgi:flagellar motility protein MotE (MotC chaperone)